MPIRHGRMLASAFSFYRGGAAIMAADLAATPSSGLKVQLCGDAHLSNFGGFAAPDRQLIFDINDFDETHPGPFEWDLKRLVASFSIGARELGFKASEGRSAVAAAAGEYREEMRRLASMRTIDVWYERLNVQALEQYRSQVSHSQAKNFDKNVAKAERKNSLRAFDRLTKSENGEIRIVSDPPLIVPIEEFLGVDPAVIEQRLMEVFAAYTRTLDRNVRHLVDGYRYVHAAHKVVGVGSVGTRAWILLLLGRDSQDPLFLQAKEAQSSVLEPYTGASQFKQQGRRVVEGQRLMQAASDIFLGWVTAEGPDGKDRDFYVRQLWDGKGSAEVERMTPEDDGALREALRLDARPRPRALRRPHRDRRVSRQGRRLRPGDRRLRRGVCGPERAGLQGVCERRQGRPPAGRGGHLSRVVSWRAAPASGRAGA